MNDKQPKPWNDIRNNAFSALLYGAALAFFLMVGSASYDAVSEDEYDNDQRDVRAAIRALSDKMDSRFEKMDSKFEKMDSKFERMFDKMDTRIDDGLEGLSAELRALRKELIQVIRDQRTPADQTKP